VRLYQYNQSFRSGCRPLRGSIDLTPITRDKDDMAKAGKRLLLGRGKGYLNAAGPQYRFIIFLIFVLIFYTFLLRVFQKLAEIVELPVFFPIALTTLLVFIGIVGVLYSHTFIGPMSRIRKAIDQLAEGDTGVSLRLRDTDDPALKEIVKSITRLSEHARNTHALVREASQDLFRELAALQEGVQRGADKSEIQKHLEAVRKRQDLLDKAVKSSGRT
jgi:methyl-accepting chemotaxis protein